MFTPSEMISVANKDAGRGPDRHLSQLTALTEAGLAILRAQLDVDALCELVYKQTGRLVEASSFHLGLFEEDRFVLKVWVKDGVRRPPTAFAGAAEGGIVGWLRATQRPLLVRDFLVEMEHLPAQPSYQAERPPRSALFVPLVAGDTVVGSLSVQSSRPNAYDEDDLQVLSILANQAASAIVNARLFATVKRRADQLATIAEVSRAITAILDLDELLTQVVELIRERFGYYHVQVFLVEDETHRAIFRASSGHHLNRLWREQGRSLRFDEGIIGWVAGSGHYLLANDVSQEPRYIADDPRLLPDTRSELAVPLKIEDKVLGVLDVQSQQLNAFDEEDLFIIRTLANQVAVAVDAALSYQAQREQAWVTSALLRVAEATARADSPLEMLNMVARLTPELTGVASCGIWLFDQSTGDFELAAAKGLRLPWEEARAALRLNCAAEELLASLQADPQMLDLSGADSRVPTAVRAALPGERLVLLPLLAQNRLLGCLLVSVEKGQKAERLHTRRLTILSGIAQQVALTLDNLRLQEQERERERIAQELQVARRIQMSFLPAEVPSVPGYQLAHTWHAARIVSGDFYDFLRLPNGRLGLLMADVADKGVPAALFMATSLTLLRVAAHSHDAPHRALTHANQLICAHNTSDMFVTVWYGVLEPASHVLLYANAGHSLALHVRATDGWMERLRTPGLPLGIYDPPQVEEGSCVLEPGDLLVLYTDGVIDATSQAGEEFGQDRLESILFARRQQSAPEILTAVMKAVRHHLGTTPPHDDITLVVVKRQ